jgi:cyclopropane-fatty-acyl-phospholipid synthase
MASSAASATASDRATGRTLAFLRSLLAEYGPRDFAVRLWDGTTLEPELGQAARFTLVLRHPGSLRALLWPPNQLNMAEAYLYDDVDIEGDIESVFRLADHLLLERRWSAGDRLRTAARLLALPRGRAPRTGRGAATLRGRRFSLERDRQAVTYHYDLSNGFFALYLDRRMVYTCAYFALRDEDLDTAQERKLDLVCRKLRLRPGDRLLDIGCGWGGLLIHAVERFGVEAVGVTLSRPQAELANERIAAAGLADRARAEVRDYRELDEPGGFDKVVSICMFEQVGEEHLPAFFAHARRQLRPGGVFLNQGIAAHHDLHSRMGRRGESFMRRYVFPDGDVVPISTALRAAEEAGFEVRDVESLREHYALTLGHWVQRLEARHDEARRHTDEVAYRIWRLYMAGARYSFRHNRLNLYQILLAKPDRGRSGLPLQRTDWYGHASPGHDRGQTPAMSARDYSSSSNQ